jgi:hypothetical protein
LSATHIIVHFPSNQRDDLFRASDGMLLASRSQSVVMFGENPASAQQRHFISAEFAYQWLKSVALADGGATPVIEERQGETKIVPASNNLAMRQ